MSTIAATAKRTKKRKSDVSLAEKTVKVTKMDKNKNVPKRQTTARTTKPKASPKPKVTRGAKNTSDTKASKRAPDLIDVEEKKAAKRPRTSKNEESLEMLWEAAEVLASTQGTSVNVARNVVRLFDEENTIPFIARYRRGLTNGMEAEQLSVMKDIYEELKLVQHKAGSVLKQANLAGKLTREVRAAILSCQNLLELDLVAAPFKVGAKRSLAERARALGLEDAAMAVLAGSSTPDLTALVCPGTAGLSCLQEVEDGVQHIIADVVSKTKEVLELVRDLRERSPLTLESHKARSVAKDKEKETRKGKVDNEVKFKDYFDFSVPVKFAKPHQVLALNRGERLKLLSVRIGVPASLFHQVSSLCQRLFLSKGRTFPWRTHLCERAFKDSWERLLQPLLSRQVRSELTRNAEKASLEVFSENLRNLLLAPPLKGCAVVGLDPGYKHGCKMAVVGASGQVLHTNTLFPNLSPTSKLNNAAAMSLQDAVRRFNCSVIALGNGTACRETEAWLGRLIAARWFQPVDVSYTIVNEQGASIYSCSAEAKEEFSQLDTNLVSAVSIARRLLEPLAELVKIDPKHLGVGMYQHDISETRLKAALDEVVQTCVSFVGVDLNTTSLYLLRRVAGLSDFRARCILAWRTEHGPFQSRKELLKVKGIGAKTFEQCAGFIRVLAASSGDREWMDEEEVTPLDSTNVHPESYAAAKKLVNLSKAVLQDLGKEGFATKLRSYVQNNGLATVQSQLGLPDVQALSQLLEALTQGPAYDPRAASRGPIFRRGVTTMADLEVGTELSGCVRNVTDFGAFVDVGVGRDGLVHVSNMGGRKLAVNNRVSVSVSNIDQQRRRIGLRLIEIMT